MLPEKALPSGVAIKMWTLAAVPLLVLVGVVCLAAEKPSPGLPRSTPEEQGVSSSGVLSFVEAADERIDAMHSFMLVRHGHVVAEGWWSPYDASTRHTLFSLTKSFTSTAVGMAVAEGRMTVDDLVLPSFPEDAPAEASDLAGLGIPLRLEVAVDLLDVAPDRAVERLGSSHRLRVARF